MYKILCLTTGSDIRWPRQYGIPTKKLVPTEVMEDIAHFYDTQQGQGIIYFATKEHADWFVRRRLSYNPARQDADKLSFMNAVFKASDMEDVTKITKKYMFDIVSC